MIVCIPTKGRPETTTYEMFISAGVVPYHFIEPQEIDLYQVPNKIDIKQADKGISYVRNFILDWATKQGEDVVFMCDDDVSALHEYVNNKNVKITVERLLFFVEKFKKTPFEIGGFNYKQLIWTAKNEYRINAQTVDQLVMIKPKQISWEYRGKFNTKEDRDFVLQTIQKGYGVLKFPKIGVSSPGLGVNKGGLHEEYKHKKDIKAVLKMVREWHPFIKIKKSKRGVLDCQIDYKGLARKYKKTIV